MLLLSPGCRGVSGVLRDGCVGTAVTAVLCSGQGPCPRLALPCWPVWRPWLPSAVSAGARAGPREPGWFGSRVAPLSSSRNLHLTNRVQAPGGCAPGSPRSGAPRRRPGGRLPTVTPAAVCAVLFLSLPLGVVFCECLRGQLVRLVGRVQKPARALSSGVFGVLAPLRMSSCLHLRAVSFTPAVWLYCTALRKGFEMLASVSCI